MPMFGEFSWLIACATKAAPDGRNFRSMVIDQLRREFPGNDLAHSSPRLFQAAPIPLSQAVANTPGCSSPKRWLNGTSPHCGLRARKALR